MIKEYLKKPLYVVINKIDTKPETEVNKVEQLIRKTLRDEGVSVQQFIRFSGKEPLDSIMTPIKSVKHDTAQDDYLDNIKVLLETTSQKVEQEKKTALNSYNEKYNDVNTLTSQVNSELRYLINKCDEVSQIPQFKEGFEIFFKFTDDKYEMSQSQYFRFTNILEVIKKQAANMNSLSNERNEATQLMQKLYENYSQKNTLNQRTEVCLNTFMRLYNRLNDKKI